MRNDKNSTVGERLASARFLLKDRHDVLAALAVRINTEIAFADRLAQARPQEAAEWNPLVEEATRAFETALSEPGTSMEKCVEEVERLLAPISPAAKEYCISLVGHAHIDMNWMWPWQETVACTLDTFTTVLRLMEEFPGFKFTQSQASVYAIVEKYAPEMFEEIRKRVAEGRWEIAASMWVEGDKNLPSGESLARHLLLTRRYFKDKFGLDYDSIRIDWEPDTFGHANTIPAILAAGGVRWYYHMRPGAVSEPSDPLFHWWQAPDGSRVLTLRDETGYNGAIAPDIYSAALYFEQQTGMKHRPFVYGVGDHGGGPTRKWLRAAIEMNDWPVFPNLKFSTVAEWFEEAEENAGDLPVHKNEINFVFRGCYTSQSSIKRGVRRTENLLVQTETAALAGKLDYPRDLLNESWKDTLFTHFHDILPGSGVSHTRDHANTLFQNVLAAATAVRSRSLRKLAGEVNTAALGAEHLLHGFGGAGAGIDVAEGSVSSYSDGEQGHDVFLVFNSCAFARRELIAVRLWDKEWDEKSVCVVDDKGTRLPAQFDGKGHSWGHSFIKMLVPVDLPPCGYRVIRFVPGLEAGEPAGKATVSSDLVLENEFVRATVDPELGALTELVDKRTGHDLAAAGGVLGSLEFTQEEPHGMTAWKIGETVGDRSNRAETVSAAISHHGPHKAAVRVTRKYGDSTMAYEISVAADIPCVAFDLDVNWLERGSKETGVPGLRARFETNVSRAEVLCETPFGTIERQRDGKEIPSQRFISISAAGAGVVLVNESKYGHRVWPDGTITLNLLRSSYDPDPLPEMGNHRISYALYANDGASTPADCIRLGQAFNRPPSVVATDIHEGALPLEASFCEVQTEDVILTALKKAEDSDALVVRLNEVNGTDTVAEVKLDARLAGPNCSVQETDLLERPLAGSAASFKGGVLKARVPAYGIATILLG